MAISAFARPAPDEESKICGKWRRTIVTASRRRGVYWMRGTYPNLIFFSPQSPPISTPLASACNEFSGSNKAKTRPRSGASRQKSRSETRGVIRLERLFEIWYPPLPTTTTPNPFTKLLLETEKKSRLGLVLLFSAPLFCSSLRFCSAKKDRCVCGEAFIFLYLRH